MKTFTFKKSALVVAMLVSASAVNAQSSDVDSTATLEISNVFALAEDATLDFGTIRASQSLNGSDFNDATPRAAGLTIVPNSTPVEVAQGGDDAAGTTPDSSVTSLVDGTPGSYTVTGAAPLTNMNIILPADFELTDGTTAAFDVAITAGDVIISTGANANAVYDAVTPNAQTDAGGTVTFLVGGTIYIDPLIDADIDDGDYTGDYDITVSY